MKRFVRSALIAAACAAPVFAAPAADAKTRLLVNCFWPPQHYVCKKVLPT